MKPNLVGLALIVIGLLFADGAVNSRSPVEVVKAILTGQKIPTKGSGDKGSGSGSGSGSNPAPSTPGPNGQPVPIPPGSHI